jgi:poly-gamma-glutamate capsule biosynthesis protein CapA/YwtB (metallophosphatase superfamily)
MTTFLCGDVMSGRGIDQILPFPSNPTLHESYAQSAVEYVALAENANGPIEKPVDFNYVWGDAIEELERVRPAARIINLETSVTTSEDYEAKGIHYRMHPANVPCLTTASIECCVLANNHVLDWGCAGLLETLATLRDAGIQTAGAGRNLSEALEPAVMETGDNCRMLVFAFGTGDSGMPGRWAVTESDAGIAVLPDLSTKTADWVAERISALKQPGDVVVVSIHWGGNWGYQIPLEQQTFAHALLDLEAADIIHGHSSHHPKGIEVYRNKPVLYGCGDFINDYEGISGQEEFRSQLVVMYFVTVDPSSRKLISLRMTPLEIKRMQLHRAGRDSAAWLQGVLTREGQRFGTRVRLEPDNRLVLEWQN